MPRFGLALGCHVSASRWDAALRPRAAMPCFGLGLRLSIPSPHCHTTRRPRVRLAMRLRVAARRSGPAIRPRRPARCLVPECHGIQRSWLRRTSGAAMGKVLHGSATTTHAVRAAIQRSKAPLKELALRYGLDRKTVAKWRKRSSEDAAMAPSRHVRLRRARQRRPPSSPSDGRPC